jgi:hypothetical protein
MKRDPKVGDVIQWSRFKGEVETSLIISSDPRGWESDDPRQLIAVCTEKKHTHNSRGHFVKILRGDQGTAWLYFNDEDVSIL